MKKKIIFLFLAATSLVVSIKQETKGYGINPLLVGLSDTIILSTNIKAKAAKAKSGITYHGVYHLQITKVEVCFCPGDPDTIMPISAAPDSAGAFRAKAQMKAYLDSLIIVPKSTDLLKNVKKLRMKN